MRRDNGKRRTGEGEGRRESREQRGAAVGVEEGVVKRKRFTCCIFTVTRIKLDMIFLRLKQVWYKRYYKEKI